MKYLKKHSLLLYSFALAALFLLLCSKSSPLYPMNDWVDVHCFRTMGRELLNGQVPYRDLYEQKGPVLYFVYALIELLSPGSFWGVYLLEVLTYGLFLYYCGRIAQLYLGKSVIVWFLMAILAGLVPAARAFAHGGSVEEMCLFMSAYGLYVCLRALKAGDILSFREAFLCGIWCGCLLWIKYTMLGLYLGIALFILIWYLLWQKDGAALLRTIGAFFAGIAAVTLPVVLYFLWNQALTDLYTVYFYNNIFLYPANTDTSRLVSIFTCLKTTLQRNRRYSLLFLPGALWLLAHCRKDPRPACLVALSFAGLAVGTYWGGTNYVYYGLVFSVFAIFGLIALALAIRKLGISRLLARLSLGSRSVCAIWALCAVLAMGLNCMKTSNNVYLMAYDRSQMPQYRFAQTISQTPDATLLNFGFLDGGFYYTSGATPACRFFCTLNVQAPDMWSEQYRQINECLADYVITRSRPLENYHVDASGYVLVDEATQYFEGVDFTYYLYRRADLA